MVFRTLVCVCLALSIVACSKKEVSADRPEVDAEVAVQTPGGPESLPVTDSANLPSQPDADAAGAPTSSGVTTVPKADPAPVPTRNQ